MRIRKKETLQVRSILSDWEISQDTIEPIPECPDSEKGNKFWVGSDELQMLMENAGVRCCWNFLTALGDTISEKYESLYLKVHELIGIMEKNNAAGYFWIVTSPEIASIFETATVGFEPTPFRKGDMPFDSQYAFGTKHIYDIGTVNKKWRLYKTSAIPINRMLIGVNNAQEDPTHYAVMTVENFIL